MMHRFLIAIFLTGFASLLFAQPNQNHRPTKADERLIDRHLKSLNCELALETAEDVDTTKQAVVDSLIDESRSKYYEGKVTYAPDRRFKIFVFTGDYVSAHAVAMYDVFIKFADGRELHDQYFLNIKGIYKMPDGKYLVLHDGYGDGGDNGHYMISATLLSVKNDKIVQHQFAYPQLMQIPPTNILQFDAPYGVVDENQQKMHYDAKAQRLYFNCTFLKERFDKTGYDCSGYYQYIAGRFVLKAFRQKKIDLED